MVKNGRSSPQLFLTLFLALAVLVAAVIVIAPQMPRLRDFDHTAAKSYASLLANGLQLNKTLAIDF